MKKLIAIASAAALGLGVAACDSTAENQAEDLGEENAEMVNEQAEAMEDVGAITDEEADAMTEVAEDQADAMEEAAEEGTEAPAM